MKSRLRATVMGATMVVGLGVATSGCTSTGPGDAPDRTPTTLAEFDDMFEELKNWGRWGEDDERGAVNLITAEKSRQAASLVQRGVSVSLSHNPMTQTAEDNPGSFEHVMGESLRSDTYRFAYHGYAVSHIDALCHFVHNGMLFNGVPATATTIEDGCVKLGIQNLKSGVVTRGVLLDIPRLKGVSSLEPGTPIYVEDIEAWEEQAGVRVSAGDVILVRTGRWARRAEQGPWQLSGNSAGLHASVLPWIRARDVSIVGSDAATDVQPSGVEGLDLPLHTMLIAGLGVNILDNMDLEALADVAAQEGRWEFMLGIGPIPVTGGTGSPVNALAVF